MDCRNQPHGLHVHRGESVSHTVVDPRQLASDARMPTIICRRQAATSEASPSAVREPLNTLFKRPLFPEVRSTQCRKPGPGRRIRAWGLRSPYQQSSLEVRERPGSVRLISYVSMPAAWCRFRVCLLHAAAPVVCCILRVVLRTGCRVPCFAHAAACPLPAARRARKSVVPHVLACIIVCCLLHVVCCMRCLVLPSSARCLPHAACCLVALLPCCLVACCQWSFPKFLLHAARCPLHAACCMLHVALHDGVVRCMLLEVWRMLPVARCMFAVRCILPAACRMLSGSWLSVARCASLVAFSPVACCVSSVTFSPMQVACCQLSVAQFPVVVCGTLSVGSCLRALSLLHVLRSPLHVVCCLLPVPVSPCRMVCAVCRLVPRRISSVACYALRVVCCTLHTAPSVLRVVSCPVVHVVCRMPPVACCRVTQRRHTRSASRRRSQLSASVAGEARCSADRGARACVRACMPACG